MEKIELCHPNGKQRLIASTNSYSTNDGSFVGGTATYWCEVCGRVHRLLDAGDRYTTKYKIIKQFKPESA